jgi:RNA polymerase sigma-70 factor (ECF subfamily)
MKEPVTDSMNLQNVLPWRQETTRTLELEDLIDQHQSMVFSIALRMTGDRGLAEEIAQDVLLELDRNLGRITTADHARFWLRQVTVHRSTDALRRRQRREPGWEKGFWVELEERHGLVEANLDSPLGERVEELLAELPEPQRAALILRYQEEMTPDEIAVTLNSPLATVKSHLQRGLKRLRNRASQTLKEYIRGT